MGGESSIKLPLSQDSSLPRCTGKANLKRSTEGKSLALPHPGKGQFSNQPSSKQQNLSSQRPKKHPDEEVFQLEKMDGSFVCCKDESIRSQETHDKHLLKKRKKKKKVGQVCCGNESLRLWRGLLTTTGASALGNHSPFLKWKHFCNVQADTRLQ